jgi:ATP-dependent Lon protease
VKRTRSRNILDRSRSCPRRCGADSPPGVATGLAWTENRRRRAVHRSHTLLPDGKDLTITGQLGEVMQESAKTARSYVWSHAVCIGNRSQTIPEFGSAHPRSRGCDSRRMGLRRAVTMSTALASVILGVACPQRYGDDRRSDPDRTGSSQYGGIKETVLAARRAGIKRVILPRDESQGSARSSGRSSQRDGVHLRGSRGGCAARDASRV